ncbi:MAG: Acg family FMN-binding oxidoreductase, partial [Beijerinckiaceae bacterium]
MVDRRTILLGSGGAALAGLGTAFVAIREMGSMADFVSATAATRSMLKDVPEARDLIRYATLAANSHNTQPWRFAIKERGIDILPDFARHLTAVDPDNHHLFASLGCAAENLSIAAGMRGKPGELTFDPANGGRVIFAFGSGPSGEAALFDAIVKRQSTRGDFDGGSVGAADLGKLALAATVPWVDLVLISDRPRMDRIRDLVIAGNTAQMGDPAFVSELKAWLRFSPRRATQTGDGLFSAASGNPMLPEWLGPIMFDLTFEKGAENDKYARQIASSAGIAVFVGQKNDPEHWVLAGRACQRFALAATAMGMKHAFINQPVEVAGLRPELAALVGLPGRRPDIVLRFGYGPELPFS